MSSPHEVSVWGAGFGPEGGEWAGVRPAGPTASRRPKPGPEPGPPGRPGSGFSDPKGFESEQEVLEAGGPVLWGREGRPGSATDARGAALDLADESAVAILQQLPDRDVLAVRGYRFPESCAAAHVSAMWAGLEAGPGGGAAPAQSCGEAPLAPAGPLHLGGPRVGRAWGNRKRGARSKSNVAADRQRLPAEGPVGLPSDPEASDEFSEIQLMRVSVYPKEGGQAKPNSPEDPGDTPRHSIFQVRKNFLHVPGAFLSSAPRGFPPVVERQGVGELDISSAKKMQSVLWGKGASRPSYPGAAAAATAAGGLPRAAPRRKGAQEKKSLGGASRLALGRAFPSWGQQTPAPPLEPATFPPVSGIPQLGRSKRYSLVPLGTKQSKHTGAGKKSVARQARESKAVAGEDNDPNRDPVPKGQLPACRPGPSCWLCMHHGEPSSGDLNTRGPQDPGNSEPLSWNQGEVMPRGPAPSAAQEPLDHPPGPQRRRQQPPGTQGCPQCLVLQREVDDLKEQLGAMQYLADKFQIL